MSETYDVTYPDGVERLELEDHQIRHFERAAKHPNARIEKIELVQEND